MTNVVMIGLPGSGKSAVGRALAARTNRTFIDTDSLVLERTGRTPAEIISSDGEAAFRAVEADVVREAAQTTNTVISTGGGAVIDPINRWELWHCGPVVWIDAPDDVIVERIQRKNNRPLTPDSEALVARRAERERFYAAADLRQSGHDTPEDAAEIIATWLEENPGVPAARTLLDLSVRRDHPMGPREARIVMGNTFNRSALADLVQQYSLGTPVVVVDQNLKPLHPGLIDAFPPERRLFIDAGEANKRISSAEAQVEFAFAQRSERSDAWVAIGGGTTGDLVGFSAAIYMRGAPLVQVPTTWLAMSDAAIGGKVGVDLAEAKNSAGAFWPPVAVITDISTIETLSLDLRLDGMGECLKSAIIGDPWLWDVIVNRGVSALSEGEDADLAARYAIIERSALLKVGVADRDPFETGERRTLNLGHTIGHALEIESGYTLRHGRAVVLGILAVNQIAVNRGILDPAVAQHIHDVVALLGFATERSFDPQKVKDALRGDKKSIGGTIRWILPTSIGTVIQASDVTDAEIDAALAAIQAGAGAATADTAHQATPAERINP